MAILHGKQELLCDKIVSKTVTWESSRCCWRILWRVRIHLSFQRTCLPILVSQITVFFIRFSLSEVELLFKLTLSQRQNLDSSKLQVFAGGNFKLGENGIKFSKRVENTVRKGEIARHEQFLLFPHSVFKRLVLPTRKNQIILQIFLYWAAFGCNTTFDWLDHTV